MEVNEAQTYCFMFQSTFSVMIGRKRAQTAQAEEDSSLVIKKKKHRDRETGKDEENFISYKPADYQSEQGYVINMLWLNHV